MALTKLLSFTIQPEVGRPKSIAFWLPDTVTVANALSFGTHLSLVLDGMTGGVITEGRLVLPITLDAAVKSSAIAESYTKLGALMGFDAENTNYNWSVWIPAVNTEVISGEEILLGETAVQNFIDFLTTDDAAAGNAHASDEFANELTDYGGGRRAVRRK